MRMERNIEQPVVLESPATPSLNEKNRKGLPREIIRVLGDVRFAPGSAALLPPSRSRLDQFIDWLRSGSPDGQYYIEVQGHTDAAGTDEQNRLVSRARAEVVRRYLCAKMNRPVESIGIVAAGSLSPVGDDRTAEGRSRNRRVVVLVLR